MAEKEKNIDVYVENGYDSRDDYLSCLAEDYGIPKSVVRRIAQVYGPSEDFDGLVATLEDMSEGI